MANAQLTPEELEKLREQRPPIWIYFVTVPLLALAVIHIARARTWIQIRTASLKIGLVIGVGLLTFFTLALVLERRSPAWREGAPVVVSVVLVAPVWGFLLYVLGVGIKDFFLWTHKSIVAPDATPSGFLFLLAIVLPIGVGSVLFWWRLNYRSVYGFTEAVVGVLIAVQKIDPAHASRLSTDPTLLLGLLTASVYLVVRGMDNIHQELTKDPKDPIAVLLVEWLRRPPPARLVQSALRERV